MTYRVSSPDWLLIDELDGLIREYFRYRPELEEVIRTPEYMLDEIWERGFFEGDCDDVSTLYAALLKSAGVRVRFVAIRYDGSAEFKHVFVEAWDGYNAEWRVLDATVEEGTPYRADERMVVDV